MEHQEFNRNPWGKSQIWHSHHYIPAFIWHLTLQNPLFPSSRNVFKMVILKNTMSTDLTFPVSTVIEGVQKAMAPHSSTLAWKIPWTGEPGRLQSMGSLRVRHDWATSLSLFAFMHWRRKWQPTPVFLPGGSQGWGSPVACCLWGRTE